MVLLSAICTTAATTEVKPTDSRIQYTGRINFSNPESPLFVYPATQIAVRISGTGLAMKAKPGSGQFMVTVDNGEARKINFTDTDSVITLVKGLPAGQHTVKVMLAIEGYEKRPEFRGLLLDSGTRLLKAPQRPKHRIEFIGNSITCGYGSEAKSQWVHYSYDNSNHYYSYAAILARELNAEEMCVARSGIGVYRNYGGHEEGQTMTRWYDYTCLYDSTQLWDFATYRPNVICVNLGTNDLKTQPHDVNLFREAYMQFARHLHSVQPQAKLVLLTGTMLKGDALNECTSVLDSVARVLRAEGVSVYRFDMTPIDGSLGWGASWHPSMRQHQLMAQELTAFLRREVLPKQGK